MRRGFRNWLAESLGYPELWETHRRLMNVSKRSREMLAIQARIIDDQAQIIARLGGAPYDPKSAELVNNLERLAR